MSGNQPRIDPSQPPYGMADTAATRNNFLVLQDQLDAITGYSSSGPSNPPLYTPLTGGTMTGRLTISTNARPTLALDVPTPSDQAGIRFRINGVDRWVLHTVPRPETGNNAGTDIAFGRYDDNGTYMSDMFNVTRQTGAIELYGDFAAFGTTFAFPNSTSFTLGGLILSNYPTTDPHVLGQVWVDTANGDVLKVSQG
jgi:hypothetical protein